MFQAVTVSIWYRRDWHSTTATGSCSHVLLTLTFRAGWDGHRRPRRRATLTNPTHVTCNNNSSSTRTRASPFKTRKKTMTTDLYRFPCPTANNASRLGPVSATLARHHRRSTSRNPTRTTRQTSTTRTRRCRQSSLSRGHCAHPPRRRSLPTLATGTASRSVALPRARLNLQAGTRCLSNLDSPNSTGQEFNGAART